MLFGTPVHETIEEVHKAAMRHEEYIEVQSFIASTMGIRELITFRVSGTGIWSYEFYDEARQKIGSVSSLVSPAVPVRIESKKIHWYSRFDIDTTIIPGIGRRVQDNQTGNEVSFSE
jgi:hypothetical protein